MAEVTDRKSETDVLPEPGVLIESGIIEVEVAPAPDGGLQAWLQVLMAHLICFNSWGYLNSFGIFQSYYTTTLSVSPSAISWIGSIQILLGFLLGSISGRALDAGYFRVCIVIGCSLEVLAVFSASVSTQYWQLVLSQGVCKGLGDGLLFTPAVALIPTYFTRKRTVALSLVSCGTATGGIVFPIIAQRLLPRVGYGWTVRVMGFIILFNSVVAFLLARVRLPPRRRGAIVEWSAFKEVPYALFCTGMFFVWWALYFAFFYVSSFAKTVIKVDTSTSLTILLVTNATGIPGRITFAFISDRFFGPLHTHVFVVFCTGVLFYSWAGVDSLGSLYAFCALYGFFAASCQSLYPPSLAALTTDMKNIGARTGMSFAVSSIATLTGAPIGGALVQKDGGKYLYAQLFGGTSIIIGVSFIVLAILAQRGRGFSFFKRNEASSSESSES